MGLYRVRSVGSDTREGAITGAMTGAAVGAVSGASIGAEITGSAIVGAVVLIPGPGGSASGAAGFNAGMFCMTGGARNRPELGGGGGAMVFASAGAPPPIPNPFEDSTRHCWPGSKSLCDAILQLDGTFCFGLYILHT